jgi:hypothetical protein
MIVIPFFTRKRGGCEICWLIVWFSLSKRCMCIEPNCLPPISAQTIVHFSRAMSTMNPSKSNSQCSTQLVTNRPQYAPTDLVPVQLPSAWSGASTLLLLAVIPCIRIRIRIRALIRTKQKPSSTCSNTRGFSFVHIHIVFPAAPPPFLIATPLCTPHQRRLSVAVLLRSSSPAPTLLFFLATRFSVGPSRRLCVSRFPRGTAGT